MRAFVLAAAMVLAMAVPAFAAIDPTLRKDLTDNGVIDHPCDYSTALLQKTLGLLGADSDQYFPGQRATINSALRAHANGSCDPKPSPTPTATSSATVAPSATPTSAAGVPTGPSGPTGAGGTKRVVDPPPTPAAPQVLGASAPVATTDPRLASALVRPPSNGMPDVLAVLLGVLGVLALLAAMLAGARRFGRTEGLMSQTRHAWREAAWRFGGGWETFRDWVRAGR